MFVDVSMHVIAHRLQIYLTMSNLLDGIFKRFLILSLEMNYDSDILTFNAWNFILQIVPFVSVELLMGVRCYST